MSKNLPQVLGLTPRTLKAVLLMIAGWSISASSQDVSPVDLELPAPVSQEAQTAPEQTAQTPADEVTPAPPSEEPLVASDQETKSTLYFSGKAQGSSSGLYAVDSKGTVSQLISGNPSQFRHVDISTVSEKAVFVADRNHRGEPGAAEGRGGINVYTVDLTGENLTAMTDNQSRELHPRFSPNGELIAYVRMEGGRHHLIMEAFRSRSGRNLLSSDEILDLAWAPDGQQLVVAKRSGVQSRLSVVDLHRLDPVETTLLWSAGENGTEDNGSVAPDYDVVAVTWSPDGEKIAYIIRSTEDERDQQLHVMNLEDSSSRRVSDSGVSVQAPVQWSKTSNYLLYAATSLADPDEEEPTPSVAEGVDAGDTQSGGQGQIQTAVAAKHIYIANLDGNVERLTSQQAWHSRPVFSPDESQVAFLFAESATPSSLALVTMDADGSNRQKLYDHVTVNSFLQWHEGIYTLDEAEALGNGDAAVLIQRLP